jgi:hypothetical protein
VSLNKHIRPHVGWVIAIVAVFTFALAVCLAGQMQAEKPDSAKLGEALAELGRASNSKCHVCHLSLKTEEITKVHVEMDITCDKCHGPSIEHMHDEMLMTKPDLLFGRSEVNKMCSNPICHAPGGERQIYGRQDHKDRAAMEAFYEKWRGKTRPNGRTVTSDSVCTDCHGTHNLDKAAGRPSQQNEQPAEWVAVFNGRDLTGWSTAGDASWTVNGGRIVGRAGPNGEAGDVWTEALYEDYLLAVTFRAMETVRAGIWLRTAGYEYGPRIEILDKLKPSVFTGSVWLTGKGYGLVNFREDLMDPEGWNTISAKVQGNGIQVWLNGEEVGAVWLPGPKKGKIGLHIEGRSASKPSELHVREVLIQRLAETEEPVAKCVTWGLGD